MFRVILALISVANICAEENVHTYRINARVYGGNINEDIVVDKEKGLMTVNVGQVYKIDTDCPSTINLHDFEKGILAMKNIDEGTCIITETSETLQDTIDLLENITRLNFKHEIKDEKFVSTYPITKQELLARAGNKIAAFCNGYDLLYGNMLSQKVHRFRRRSDKRQKEEKTRRCSGFCLICFIKSRAEESVARAPEAITGAERAPVATLN